MQSIENNANLLSNIDKYKIAFVFRMYFPVPRTFLFCGSVCHISYSKRISISLAVPENEVHNISFQNFPLKNVSLFNFMEKCWSHRGLLRKKNTI